MNIDANPEAPISELKEQIEEISGYPASRIELKFSGKVLDDQKLYKSYHIRYKPRLTMALKPDPSDDSFYLIFRYPANRTYQGPTGKKSKGRQNTSGFTTSNLKVRASMGLAELEDLVSEMIGIQKEHLRLKNSTNGIELDDYDKPLSEYGFRQSACLQATFGPKRSKKGKGAGFGSKLGKKIRVNIRLLFGGREGIKLKLKADLKVKELVEKVTKSKLGFSPQSNQLVLKGGAVINSASEKPIEAHGIKNDSIIYIVTKKDPTVGTDSNSLMMVRKPLMSTYRPHAQHLASLPADTNEALQASFSDAPNTDPRGLITDNCFTLIVMNYRGLRLNLKDVNPSKTVLDVKNLVEEQTGIPYTHQRFVFNGRVLGDNSMSLRDAGILNGNRAIQLTQKAG